MHVQAFLRGESAPFAAFHLGELVDMSNSMAQEAGALEREVTNYWLAHYFRAESQKNPERSWKAMLLMWMRTVSALSSLCHCPPSSCCDAGTADDDLVMIFGTAHYTFMVMLLLCVVA